MPSARHLLAVALVLATPAAVASPNELVAGRALVKLRGITAEDATAAISALGKRTGVDLGLVRASVLGWGLYEVRDVAADHKVAPTEEETRRLVEALAADADVEGAVVDRWYRPFAVPTDPGYFRQWDLGSMGMEAAWSVTTGAATQRIGVVDTGTVRTHEDLQAKDQHGYDFISSANVAADNDGRDADYTDPGDGADCGQGMTPSSFHGTHVAGTILAATNNGKGIAGINWNARLVTARAMGRCGGELSDVLEAAAWLAGYPVAGVPAIGANKVSVMNLSLGGAGGCNAYEQQVIDYVNAQGVIFVAAAGNDGGPVGTPANCRGVVADAAHGPGNSRPLAAYSSFGTEIQIVAPGGDQSSSEESGIISAVGPSANTYTFYQGTSMASPHVAGVISLAQAINPSLTRDQLVTLMQQTGADCTNCQGKKALRANLLLAAVPTGGGSSSGSPSSSSGGVSSSSSAGTPGPGGNRASFDTGAAATCGATLTGTLTAGETEWFRFQETAGRQFRLVLDGPAGQDFDLYLTRGPTDADIIARSEGNTPHEEISTGATGASLGIAVVAYRTSSGNYTLAVTCANGGTSGSGPSSSSGSSPPPSGDDASEPNNDPGHASTVGCGTTTELVARDADFFAVTVEDKQDLVVTVRRGTADVDVLVSDAMGNALEQLRTVPGADLVLKETNLPGGTYHVVVTPVGGQGTPYTLGLACESGGGGGEEPVMAGCGQARPSTWLTVLSLAVLFRFRRRA